MELAQAKWETIRRVMYSYIVRSVLNRYGMCSTSRNRRLLEDMLVKKKKDFI